MFHVPLRTLPARATRVRTSHRAAGRPGTSTKKAVLLPAHSALTPIALLWLAGTALRIPVLATPPVIPAIHDDLALTATGVGTLAAAKRRA